jgi:hypothetical protein
MPLGQDSVSQTLTSTTPLSNCRIVIYAEAEKWVIATVDLPALNTRINSTDVNTTTTATSIVRSSTATSATSTPQKTADSKDASGETIRAFLFAVPVLFWALF